jgi:Putative transposase of IS4/5 family (DUF4096)
MPTIDELVPEQLWQAIQPLLPTLPRRYGGRPRVDDRACLAGIVYQLRTASPGDCCPRASLAVAARSPAGGGCVTGSAPACGSNSAINSLTSSAGRASLTGHVLVWTR